MNAGAAVYHNTTETNRSFYASSSEFYVWPCELAFSCALPELNSRCSTILVSLLLSRTSTALVRTDQAIGTSLNAVLAVKVLRRARHQQATCIAPTLAVTPFPTVMQVTGYELAQPCESRLDAFIMNRLVHLLEIVTVFAGFDGCY